MRLLETLPGGTDSIELVKIEVHRDASVFHNHLLKGTGRRVCGFLIKFATAIPSCSGLDCIVSKQHE